MIPNKKYLVTLFAMILLFSGAFLYTSAVVSAQIPAPGDKPPAPPVAPPTQPPGGTTQPPGGAVAPPTQPPGGTTRPDERLFNPLKVNSIGELLSLILNVVTIFAVPIVVFFLIYSGFLYVTAQGKPEAIQKATTAFTWTIVGGLIVLGANTLLTIIQKTVESLHQ